jgi:hypothetical protein
MTIHQARIILTAAQREYEQTVDAAHARMTGGEKGWQACCQRASEAAAASRSMTNDAYDTLLSQH